MGSGSKKHKKDKDSKKHKHRSRSRSPRYSPDVRIIRDNDKDTRKHKHRERQSRSRSPIKLSHRSKSRERSKERRHHHHHHKRHKERKNRRRSPSVEKVEDYHSDSSDVIEVPIAPPAPIISKEKSKSPIPESGAGDCLSIQETNKLRAKLGLKPLEVESSAPVKESSQKKNEEGLHSFKDEWGEFLHKPAEHIGEKAEAEKIREKLKQRKEKRILEDKLKRVKTLGESDEEIDDITKWVVKNKKKDELRKEAEKRAKALEELDAEFGVNNLVEEDNYNRKRHAYKDRDLRGLQVEHDIDEFTEGKTVILTLKDKGVLEDNDDALVNVNLVDEERYRRNVENRKQKPNLYGYNVYEEQYDEFGQPLERELLGKYDEEIGGVKKKSFKIGENVEEEKAHKRKILEIRTKLAGKRLETLDELILRPAVDTYSEAELEKFKKPKKKVKRLRQKLKPDDLLPLPGQSDNAAKDFGRRRRNLRDALMTDDTPDIREDMSNVKVEVEDEEDLQRALSKARKLKQKESIIRKSLPIDPNEMKAEIKSEPESDDEMTGTSKDGNITLNATAEFCRTLGDIPTYGMAGNREVDSNDIMDFDREEPEPEVPENKPVPSTGTWNSVNPDCISVVLSDDNSNDVSDVAILDEEPDVGAGVAAALRLALSKGYLEKEDKNRPSNSKMAHLQAKNYSIEDKAYGDEDKFGRRDRYHAGPIMEFKEKDSFKPNVKLEYIDDNGRVLNAKEAFRYLSHKFHGKGPGKNKIEKRLKKMEQEGLMKKMSSTDTPLGTLSMLQQKQKETQAPYVVLSGGKQTHVSTSIAKHK